MWHRPRGNGTQPISGETLTTTNSGVARHRGPPVTTEAPRRRTHALPPVGNGDRPPRRGARSRTVSPSTRGRWAAPWPRCAGQAPIDAQILAGRSTGDQVEPTRVGARRAGALDQLRPTGGRSAGLDALLPLLVARVERPPRPQAARSRKVSPRAPPGPLSATASPSRYAKPDRDDLVDVAGRDPTGARGGPDIREVCDPRDDRPSEPSTRCPGTLAGSSTDERPRLAGPVGGRRAVRPRESPVRPRLQLRTAGWRSREHGLASSPARRLPRPGPPGAHQKHAPDRPSPPPPPAPRETEGRRVARSRRRSAGPPPERPTAPRR